VKTQKAMYQNEKVNQQPLRNLTLVAVLSLFSFHAIASDASFASLQERFSDEDYTFVIDSLEDKNAKTTEEYNLLISALMNEDLDDAEEAAEQFVEAYNNDYRAYHMYASVMGAQASSSIFSALGYAKKAKTSLEKAVTIAPERVEVYQALMQFHIAAPSIAGGDTEEARKLVDKIAEIDATEGLFSKAYFLMSEGQKETAVDIYKALAESQNEQARALSDLGNHYLQDEDYENAFDTLMPFMTMNIAEVNDKTSSEWDAYERDVFNVLYGQYRLGLAAVKSGKQTQVGIRALMQYLEAVKTTNIDTADLPSTNWANLRLAELLLNDNQLTEANDTLMSINASNNTRFNKILKDVKKSLKKRA
jgi:tetratricopeptide (TPR) repeat protein